jgi:hypothetical protein
VSRRCARDLASALEKIANRVSSPRDADITAVREVA